MILRSISWGFKASIGVTLNSDVIYKVYCMISKSENTILTLVYDYGVDFVGF